MNSKNSTQRAPRLLPGKHENKHLILAEIVFGDPNEADCSGVGICRLLPNNLHRSAHISTVPATIFCSPAGGFELHFRRADLSETVWRKQFQGVFFRIQTAVLLPRWLQKKMPAPASAIIPSGHYRCRETVSGVTVILYE
jgi:hypothetical protein